MYVSRRQAHTIINCGYCVLYIQTLYWYDVECTRIRNGEKNMVLIKKKNGDVNDGSETKSKNRK